MQACELGPRRRPLRLRSEEHTSELPSRRDLVCRLLLEKKNEVAGTVEAELHREGMAGADGGGVVQLPTLQERRHEAVARAGEGQVPCAVESFFLIRRQPPKSTLFPYTTLFR